MSSPSSRPLYDSEVTSAMSHSFNPSSDGIFIQSVSKRVLRGFAVAAFATACSLAVSLLLRPTTYQTPYLPYYAAVLIAVLVGGFRAGVLATCLSAIAVHYYLLPPYNSFEVSLRNSLQGVYFCLTFSLICWLIDRRRARADTEISSREADLRRAQSVASTGSWRLNIRNELMWTEETYKIFGIEPGTPMTYEKFLHSVHPKDREHVHTRWQAALKGEPYDIEHRILVKGEEKWVRETAKLEFDDSGQLKGGFGAAQDITKRKHAELALRQSESRLRTVLQTLPVGVWLTDELGKIVFGNPAAQRIWGGARYVGIEQQGEYKGWWYNTEKRIAAHEWALARALIKGETALNELVEIESFDGQRKIIYNSGIPILEDGRIIGALAINEDVTDRKQAETTLMRTEKLAAAGRLAASIAHEINNPLEAVTNILYLAQLNSDDNSELKKLLDSADQELKRVSHIARTTLGFYRDSSAPSVMELASVVEDVIGLYERKLYTKHVSIEKRIVPGTAAFVNSGEVRQVVANLIANAIDAVQQGGKIHITLCPPRKWHRTPHVSLVVADNGTGIPRKDLSRVFEAFYTTKGNSGTGLGLWLSKQLLENHGGSIRVRSTEGKGSIFRVLLPAK